MTAIYILLALAALFIIYVWVQARRMRKQDVKHRRTSSDDSNAN